MHAHRQDPEAEIAWGWPEVKCAVGSRSVAGRGIDIIAARDDPDLLVGF
jgi:hypothetical protein